MASSSKLIFVTGNANKLKEVKYILSQPADGQEGTLPLEMESRNVVPEIPEIQGTSQEVAIDKCRRAAEALQAPVLTEDTGLAFKALNGLPGPYIKWFLKSVGHAGLNNMLVGFEDKSATAICTFAYCAGPGHEPILFEGHTQGRIVPARGPGTFGWDAVFEPEEQREGEERKTYAEMEPAQKNAISHRYKALKKVRAFLEEQAKASASS